MRRRAAVVRARRVGAADGSARATGRSGSDRSGQLRPEIVAARGLDGAMVVGGEIDVPALVGCAPRSALAPRCADPALPVDRARHLDLRARTLASRRCSWHDSTSRAAHARGDWRVRSVSRQRRAGRSREPVDPVDVPRRRSHADRRRRPAGRGRDRSRRSVVVHGAVASRQGLRVWRRHGSNRRCSGSCNRSIGSRKKSVSWSA